MQEQEVLKIHPVALAFVGDAAYSLYVREKLIRSGEDKPIVYQKAASAAVSARGQNELLQKIEPIFTEEEAEIFRRARNSKKNSKAKNATAAEYNRSTGLEAVIGYLYLSKNYARLEEILSLTEISTAKTREEMQKIKEFKP